MDVMDRKVALQEGRSKSIEWKLTDDAFQQLAETRKRIMRGRVFDDGSTDIVRRFRDGVGDDPVATVHGSRKLIGRGCRCQPHTEVGSERTVQRRGASPARGVARKRNPACRAVD